MYIMEKENNSAENSQDNLSRRNRKFGDKVISEVLAGLEARVLNPRFYGLGGYRDEAVYPYIQNGLAARGIQTEIAQKPIESGSEAPIPQDILVVTHRPETE